MVGPTQNESSEHGGATDTMPPRGKRNARTDSLAASTIDANRVVLFAPRRLTIESAALFRDIVRGIVASNAKDIILDCSDCSYIDSAGIAELVVAFTFCRNSGGSFSLNRLPEKVEELLRITHLYQVFEVFKVDYSNHAVVRVSPENLSALHAALRKAALQGRALLLTVRDGRVQLLGGNTNELYRVRLETDPDHELILAAPYLIADLTRSYLREELEEFEYLINSPTASERVIQKFLEGHPKFLLGQNYESLHPQVMLERENGGALIPDFLLQPFGTNFCDVLDLKLPDAELTVGSRNRRRFSAAVAEASAQLRQYRDYFEDRAQRHSVMRRYGITAYRPRLAVVIGKKPELEDEVLYRQIQSGNPGVEVVTYDALLSRAKNFLLL